MQVPWRKRVSRVLRGRLRSLALSNHGIGVVADTRNGLLVLDPRDFGVSSSLLGSGSYDRASILWLSRLLTPQSRLVFVGAHVGALLVPIALATGARAIVAFEPAPRNYRLLMINLALNGLTSVTAHNAGVGAFEGTARFTENPINTGNSRVSQSGEMAVKLTTLDAALPDNSPGVDLLVMDTEGFEVHAMAGAPRTLAQTRYLYVEYAPEQLLEQGSTPAQFLDLVADRFESMYVGAAKGPAQFFPSKSYVRHLQELPTRRGLLLNLLFSNDRTPAAPLLECSG